MQKVNPFLCSQGSEEAHLVSEECKVIGKELPSTKLVLCLGRCLISVTKDLICFFPHACEG